VASFVGFSYLVFLCPGLHWRDAGELSAAAHSLGVAHPTGFPAYLLIAKLASLLPVGSVAFRVNLVSAVAAASAVGLCYRIIVRLADRSDWPERAAAASAAIVLGSGSTLWLHATTAEVYAITLFGVILLLWWLIRGVTEGSLRHIYAAAVLTGLGLGVHVNFALTAGLCWLWVLGFWVQETWRSSTRDWGSLARRMGWVIALGLAGSMVLVYLPIRAAQDPWVNWGDVTSWAALWDHLSGARIRMAYASKIGGFSHLDTNMELALRQLVHQCSWGTALGLVGFCWLALRRKWLGGLLGCLWLSDILFTALINPMAMEDRQTGLVATLCTVIAMGYVSTSIARWMVKEMTEWGAAISIVLAVFGLTAPAALSDPHWRNLRTLYQAADLADVTLEQAATDAVVMVSSDDLAGTLLYAQGVEGQRPDVTSIVKQHVPDAAYMRHLKRHGPGHHISESLLALGPTDATVRQRIDQLLTDNRDRAIYWETGDPVIDAWYRMNVAVGLPVGLMGAPLKTSYIRICTPLRVRWGRLSGGVIPTSARRMLSRMYSMLAVHGVAMSNRFGALGKRQESRKWVSFSGNAAELSLEILDLDKGAPGQTECERIVAPSAMVLTNYAATMHRLADAFQGEDMPVLNAKAERCFRRVAELRPGEVRSWFNLGKARFRNQSYEGARTAFEEALLLGPEPSIVAQIEFYGAVMDANDGQLQTALDRLQSVMPELGEGQRREAERICEQIKSQLHRTSGESGRSPSSNSPVSRP
jgi:hypothetical protein